MTLKIEIEAHPDRGDLRGQVDNAMAALGFSRAAQEAFRDAVVTGTGVVMTKPDGSVERVSLAAEEAEGTAEQPKRERGKPAPGRARRTKEEIAEDEAADAADAAEAAQAEQPQISTSPENRVGPEDDPQTAEQDKTDEQAEVEAAREPEKPLTRDDVKAAMTRYVQAYGMPATQEDGPKIIGAALGDPPKGEEAWKLSLIPDDDQARLSKVVAAFEEALAKNPFKRNKV